MTNEEIAEQCVVVRDSSTRIYQYSITIGLNGANDIVVAAGSDLTTPSLDRANEEAGRVKKLLIPLFQRAREEGAREALEHGLPGAPMTEEGIASIEQTCKEIYSRLGMTDPWETSHRLTEWIKEYVPKLTAHIRWLTRLLYEGDAGDPTWKDGYKAGYVAAEEKGKRELEELQERLDDMAWDAEDRLSVEE